MNEWKKVILYAVLPALIAGLFAISPKFYEEFTKPKAILEYQITKGPILGGNDLQKSIYAINVLNNGKMPLSNINAAIQTPGSIDEISIYENTGLLPHLDKDSKSVSIETFHPGEKFTISLMLVAKDKNTNLDLILRSKETLGTEIKNTGDNDNKKRFGLESAIPVALSVFIMALYVMIRFKKGSVVSAFTGRKPDLLFYIAAFFGFKDIVDQHGIEEGSITYLRFADMLFSKGRIGNNEEKKNAVLALKCMLFNSDIADLSKSVIIDNIKKLEGDEFSDEEINLIIDRSEKLSELIEIRKNISEYTENPTVFLSSSNELTA